MVQMKISTILLCSLILLTISNSIGYNTGDYLSPSTVTSDKEGNFLYITEYTANKIAVYDVKNNKVVHDYPLSDPPTGSALSIDEKTLFVTAGAEKGKLFIIDLVGKKIKDIIPVGHSPNTPVLGKEGKVVYVNNQFNNDISVIEINSKKEITRIPVLREPVASVITPDGKFLYVANLLPVGPADQGFIASSISVISLSTNKLVKNIPLPNGSNAVQDITISPDGKHVYTTHILARYQMPTTQLERGWMNTSALSIINVNKQSYTNTVLLDDIDLGAANPWGVKCTDDGKYICVSIAGTHEISVIDRNALHSKLAKVEDGLTVAGFQMKPENVKNDLAFLAEFKTRIKLSGLGPRGITIVSNKVYAAEYFSGSIGVVDIEKNSPGNVYSIPLGEEKEMSIVRKGELSFHDARNCFQFWQSCSSCHPGGARSDALNWDLLNDGVGNPKNSKNLSLAHITPPAMSTGVRDKAEMAVRAGIKYIQFAELPDEVAISLDEYLKSLQPVTSPHRIDGKLSEAATRGEELFYGAKCAECHSGELYTDLKIYDVGTGKGREMNLPFDTPTLIENWRTAPYLHDGRAGTIKEVITTYNPDDKHGATSGLSDAQIDDLIKYVLSQ
jgi:YVTN family beta-propeller protein